MQAVLFEIQLLKSVEADEEGSTYKEGELLKASGPPVFEDMESQGGPEFSREESSTVVKDRRGSHGLRSILLKGEMRYLKDVNMLVFLCSPL
jgi:guanylate cyclase, other